MGELAEQPGLVDSQIEKDASEVPKVHQQNDQIDIVNEQAIEDS